MRLSSSTRAQFQTLLDAHTLTHLDDPRFAIVYLSPEDPPLMVSRREFRDACMQYAAALQQAGIQSRDLVIIAHTQNLESIFAFWAALFVGAIPSMMPTLTEKLDPEIYMQSLEELVKLSGVKAILTTAAFQMTLQERIDCPIYSSEILRQGDRENFQYIQADSHEIAFLQHSSGTTGLQKGVALSHQAVLNQLAHYSDAIALNSDDVIVSWLPLYHDMGLIAGFLMPLIQGIPLVLMSPFDWVKSPVMLLKAIHDYHGTLCWLPNFAYHHCARRIRQRDSDGLSLESLRMLINCSEPVHHHSHVLFSERFGVPLDKLSVCYAMAENTFAVTQTPPGQPARLDLIDRDVLEQRLYAQPIDETTVNPLTQVSCGAAINGTQIRIMGAKGEVLADRGVGEIAIKSDCLLTEYYQRPDLQPFSEGWYLTGDRGYLVDGEVFIVGRSKDLIINAGKNVYPQDIEAVVNTVDGVHTGRVVAFGVPDEREGTELIAVIAEVHSDDPTELQRIKSAIRLAVAQKTTVSVTYVALVNEKWLIKTSSGKIARGANRQKWLQSQSLQ
ncbi:MAG: AMP-binding protein [Anaerolineae bacterium]|nr:AMP-binding protein [Anaerolineae bacterium]